jgi:hypothetical protein
MKLLLSAALALALGALFPGCAHAPPTLPTDTLVYMVFDVSELPGAFVKAVLQTPDKSWNVGTAWDASFREDQKIIVAYTTIPYDRPIYLAEIHADDSGILKGNRYDMYVMSAQETPLRIARSGERAGIRYGGAFKFKLIEHGLLKANNFVLERCPKCPGEKEVLEFMTRMTGGGADLLRENGYLGKIERRLKGMK